MDNEFESFGDQTFAFGEPENKEQEPVIEPDFENAPEPETAPQPEPEFPPQPAPQPTYQYQGGYEYHNARGFNADKKPEKKSVGTGTVIVSAILAAIIGASASLGVLAYINKGVVTSKDVSQNTNLTNQVTNITVDETAENIIEAVAQKVTPSVVGIATTAATINFFGGGTESTGEGSGIIYSKDGYIITNYHVIESAVVSSSSKIEVYLASDTEKAYSASVVGYNISHDLAVIKISANNLPVIELADASKLKPGQFVAAIGNPGGLEFMGSVTYGVISGLNRVLSDGSSEDSVRLIQTDAAINPGNSGGALVNIKGQLIGVNSSKIAATDYEGMGFAIPVDTVKEICDKIIDKENDPNPYIGITLSEKYSGETLKELGYPEGAVVKSVTSGAPAYNAGIRSGDIIVEFGDAAITDYSELYDAISKSKPGSTVKVKIYRSRRYYTTTVKIGSNNSQ